MSSSGDVTKKLEELERSLNGLRRAHRDLKETVEDEVLDYIGAERETFDDLEESVKGYGELMREIKVNRDRIDRVRSDLSGEVAELREEMDDRVDAVEREDEEEIAELKERIRKLETRVEALARRE